MVGQITLFGDVHLSIGDHRIDRFETRKTALLFAILAAEPGRWHDRTVLADRIWPDDYADATLPRLRQALASLRRSMGDCADLIESDRVRIRLAGEHWTSDYERFQSQVAGAKRGQWEGITVPELPLLEGYSEPWATSLRQHTAGQIAWLKANMPQAKTEVAENTSSASPAALAPWQRGNQSLFGRDADIRKLANLLTDSSESPLITVIGLGGIGKTSLVKSVMAEVSPSFGGRLIWIDLSGESHVTEFVSQICQSLSAAEPEAARQLLAGQPALAVIDNAEHLIDSVANGVQELLEEFPGLKILVTSRVALELSEERIFPLGPLEVPSEQDFSDSLDIPSVALFMRSAQRANPGLELDQNILEICRRLEGIPLAIRLAAGRCQSLTPAELLADLSNRLELLQTQHRDVPVRQRKMTSVIEWSLDQLSPQTRTLLEHLAEFSAPWTQSLASDLVGKTSVVNEIQELLSFALISREDRESQYFRVLMPIREFVRATRSPEQNEAALRAHAELFLAKSADLGYGMESRYLHFYDYLRAQVDEFWRAHAYWLTRDPIRSLQLANNVHYTLAHSDGETLGRQMLEASLEAATEATDSDRALAYVGLANLHSLASDVEAARAAVERGRELATRAESLVVLTDLMTIAGHMEMTYGDYDRAEAYYNEALAVADRRQDPDEEVYNRGSIGYLYAISADRGDRIEWLNDCLAKAQEENATIWICNMYKALAISHFGNGQSEMALSYTQAARDSGESASIHKIAMWSHAFEALILLSNGHLPAAQSEIRAGAAVARRLSDHKRTVDLIIVAAELLGEMGDHESVARLIGALDAFHDRYRMIAPGYLRSRFEAGRRRSQEILGTRFGDAHITGAFEGIAAALTLVSNVGIGVVTVETGRRIKAESLSL